MAPTEPNLQVARALILEIAVARPQRKVIQETGAPFRRISIHLRLGLNEAPLDWQDACCLCANRIVGSGRHV